MGFFLAGIGDASESKWPPVAGLQLEWQWKLNELPHNERSLQFEQEFESVARADDRCRNSN